MTSRAWPSRDGGGTRACLCGRVGGLRYASGVLALRADPWTPDHGMGFEAVPDEPPARAEPFVETEDWGRAIGPSAFPPGPVWFVDGVRRVELRLLARDGNAQAFGLFGTFAVGAVRSHGRATFADHAVDRAVVVGGGLEPARVEVEVGGCALAYRPVSDPGSEPDRPLHRLQKEMQRAESDLAIRLAAAGDELVLADGRWASQQPTSSPVVGIVKRWTRAYLLPEQEALVASLGPGERTPLFGLAEPDEPLARYAWYARLCAMRPEWHDHAGVVRCEVRAGIGLDVARALADRVTSLLPAFSGRTSDPRYPQNLAPVAGLERWLQHRMGHRGLIRRALIEWLTQTVGAGSGGAEG